MGKRTIHFLTASRAEYDLMAPVIELCAADRRLQVGIIVAGAHLSPFHGLGVRQIEADGWPIVARLETLLAAESWSGRALSCGLLIESLSRFFADHRPDLLFVAGDREEALAGALVANFHRVFVAHSHGGDRCIASDVDEVLRPAISKLAHLHFAATEGHRQRLLQMGERPEQVFTVGAAGLDRLRALPDRPPADINAELGVDLGRPFFLVIFHPTSTMTPETSGQQMRQVLEGALALGHPVLCSYPNFDPGNIQMRAVIDELSAQHAGRLVAYHNLDRRTFVTLYRRCSAIVGNSSSLIIESTFLKVPAILVGPRQDLREHSANVLRVEARGADITAACRRALDDSDFRARVSQAPSLYGDGFSAPRIAETLATVELTDALLNKVMTY